jgi:hypothetical protein
MEGGNEPRFVVNTKESNLGGHRLTNTKSVNYVKMDFYKTTLIAYGTFKKFMARLIV